MWSCLTLWKTPWRCKRLEAGGEGDDRGWDGWMASLTQQTWVWVDSGSWWWTGRPGVLRFMGSQRVWHDWELNWAQNLYPRRLSQEHSLSSSVFWGPVTLGVVRAYGAFQVHRNASAQGDDGAKGCALESEDSEFTGARRSHLLKGFPIQVGQWT